MQHEKQLCSSSLPVSSFLALRCRAGYCCTLCQRSIKQHTGAPRWKNVAGSDSGCIQHEPRKSWAHSLHRLRGAEVKEKSCATCMHDWLPALKCSLRLCCCSFATFAPRPMPAGEAETRKGGKGKGMCPGYTIPMHRDKGLGRAVGCYTRAAPRLPQPAVGWQPDTELGSHNQVSHSASTNVDSAKPKLWPSALAEHGAWDVGVFLPLTFSLEVWLGHLCRIRSLSF